MSKINIIMATFRGERYLSEQIESLLCNTYQDWTLVICDDGSDDKTIDIVKEYVSQYPDKMMLHQNVKNRGVVANFLSGIEKNQAEYYMFCDQDDVWLPNKIEHTLRFMKRLEKKHSKETPLTVFSDAKVVDERLVVKKSSFHAASKLDVGKIDLQHILMENKLMGCTMMFNAAVVDKLKKLPASARMHDWWIALVAAAFGKIAYLDEATLLYRQHEKNVVGNQNFLAYFSNRITSIKKQKVALYNTIKQAETFYDIYKDELASREKEIIEKFVSLNTSNAIKKRYLVLSNGFLKSGCTRNIGLFFII